MVQVRLLLGSLFFLKSEVKPELWSFDWGNYLLTATFTEFWKIPLVLHY